MKLNERITWSIRPLLTACAAFVAASVPGFAQTAPAANKPAEKKEIAEIVLLSKFEVVSTKDKGYTTGNTGGAFKTNDSLDG
mgnify:CR=1 FL=1